MRLLLPLILITLLAGCRGDDGITESDEGWLQRGGAEVRDSSARTVRLDGRPLVLDVGAGSVTVVGSDGAEAHFQFERVARAGSESAARDRLERMRIDETGDTEAYRISAPVERAGFGEVHVLAEVPRDTELRVRIDRGEVRLSGVRGAVTVEASNGSVEAAGLAGSRVHVATRRGHQTIGFAEIPPRADIRLRTENGDLDLTLPPAGDAEVVVATAVGSVATTGLDLSRRRFEERRTDVRFRARLGGGSASIRGETEIGNITLRGGVSERLDDIAPRRPDVPDPNDPPPNPAGDGAQEQQATEGEAGR